MVGGDGSPAVARVRRAEPSGFLPLCSDIRQSPDAKASLSAPLPSRATTSSRAAFVPKLDNSSQVNVKKQLTEHTPTSSATADCRQNDLFCGRFDDATRRIAAQPPSTGRFRLRGGPREICPPSAQFFRSTPQCETPPAAVGPPQHVAHHRHANDDRTLHNSGRCCFGRVCSPQTPCTTPGDRS